MTREELVRMIDLSVLGTSTVDDVIRGAWEAQENKYRGIVVHPVMLEDTINTFKTGGYIPRVSAVCNYPFGCAPSSVVCEEMEYAFSMNADEIDLVAPLHLLMSDHSGRDYALCAWANMINLKYWAVEKKKPIKMIIESSILSDSKIELAVDWAISMGCRCIKTSTGVNGQVASVSAVKRIKEKIGTRAIELKASGGIKNILSVVRLVEAGATIIGTSNGRNLVEELDQMHDIMRRME